MASQGATVLFVPTNNGLPQDKADVRVHTRNVDIARAVENRVSVIRADVAGRTENLVSYGSSGIVDPYGIVLQSAQRLNEDLLVADIETVPRERSLKGGTKASNRGLSRASPRAPWLADA